MKECVRKCTRFDDADNEYTHTLTQLYVSIRLLRIRIRFFFSMGLSRGHKITLEALQMAVILVDYPSKWVVYLCSALAINTVVCISNAFRV